MKSALRSEKTTFRLCKKNSVLTYLNVHNNYKEQYFAKCKLLDNL